MSQPKCRCGHTLSWHMDTRPDYIYRPCMTNRCANVCDDYQPFVAAKPGDRLVFGVHQMPPDAAETAEAWPPLPAWSARVKQHTTRALRRLR